MAEHIAAADGGALNCLAGDGLTYGSPSDELLPPRANTHTLNQAFSSAVILHCVTTY